MKDLQSKEHYCYKIHTLLMKSSAYLLSIDSILHSIGGGSSHYEYCIGSPEKVL